jgi:hypothetical protein
MAALAVIVIAVGGAGAYGATIRTRRRQTNLS